MNKRRGKLVNPADMRSVAFSLTTAALLLAQSKPLEFDVATIKTSDPNARNSTMRTLPDGTLEISNMTVKQMIAFSHNIREAQILEGPPWLGKDKFDVQAKVEQPSPPPFQELQRQSNERLGTLLSTRFQLVLKSETRDLPVYALVIAKGGSKLQTAKDTDLRSQSLRVNRGNVEAASSDLASITRVLANQVEKPVLDKTGLTGRFDWKLEFSPDNDPAKPSLFTAVQEQLGLKLESQKAMMPVLIVGHAEKPTAN